MRFKRFFLLLTAAIVLVSVFSCKKKEGNKPSWEYFKGKLEFSIPPYVLKGETYIMKPSGVYRKDKGDFGYFWTLPPVKPKQDTVKKEGAAGTGEYTFVVPDALSTLTISCTAFAKGYYNSTAKHTVKIVDPEKSIKWAGSENQNVEIDPRDNKKLSYVAVGEKKWMSKNLAFEGAGLPFEQSNAMKDVFGYYYTYNQAVAACPAGWRLPSVSDFEALCASAGTEGFKGAAGSLMADAYFNEEKMWEFWPDVKITNKTGFSAIPTGYASLRSDGADFKGNNNYAAFWTSDELAEEGKGVFVYLYVDKKDLMKGQADKDSFAVSVRCIKD